MSVRGAVFVTVIVSWFVEVDSYLVATETLKTEYTHFLLFFGQSGISSKDITKESTRHSSSKWSKTLYQDYLHHIANFCVT